MKYTLVMEVTSRVEYDIEADSIEEAAAACVAGDRGLLVEREDEDETLESGYLDDDKDVTDAFRAACEAEDRRIQSGLRGSGTEREEACEAEGLKRLEDVTDAEACEAWDSLTGEQQAKLTELYERLEQSVEEAIRKGVYPVSEEGN